MSADVILRRHFSAAAIEKLEDFRLPKREAGSYFKPAGLWYSAATYGDGWEDWCRSETFGIDRLSWAHAVTVDLDRLLVIRDSLELDVFHERYSFERSDYFRDIDWPRVESEYAGIEIAPYHVSRRLSSGYTWYYSWDCASGCLWDLTAVTSWGPPERFVGATA